MKKLNSAISAALLMLAFNGLWPSQSLAEASAFNTVKANWWEKPDPARVLGEALLNATGKGDLAAVRKLIKKGANVNYRNEDDCNCDWSGATPLTYAARFGYLEIAKVLVKAGARVNMRGNFNNTPLYFAARGNRLKMAKFFIQKGANINRGSLDRKDIPAEGRRVYGLGETPLMIAAANDHLEMVEFLIDSGADIHIRNVHGKNALSFATADSEVYFALIDAGAYE